MATLTWPVPRPGLVVRYSYLWDREAREGREDGAKDRPCAIVLVLLRDGPAPIVRVLPITHSIPTDPADALEIPLPTKVRLGLDADRSWIILSEANDFLWPGPDLRPRTSGDLESAAYGMLPPGFFKILRDRLVERWRMKSPKAVRRSE